LRYASSIDKIATLLLWIPPPHITRICNECLKWWYDCIAQVEIAMQSLYQVKHSSEMSAS
jgi:hypothetical protein